MPRDSSGNYTLPAGNPVVTGSTIASSWANTTFNDMATEMTDSLSRSGKGGMLAAFKIADGAVGAPSLAFSSEPTTGFYRIGAADVALTLTGTEVIEFTLTAMKLSSGVDLQLNGVSVHNGSIISAGTVGAAYLGSGTANSNTFLAGNNTWQTVNFSQLGGSIANGQVPLSAVSQWGSSFKAQNIAGLSSTSITIQADPGGTPSGSPGDMFLYY